MTTDNRINRNYAVISPCRDEEDYVRETIESVLAQTFRPTKWVIVDDGSTDNTTKIIEEYEAQYPFIHLIKRKRDSERRVGPGVVHAFYEGYAAIDPLKYDYICKMDTDLKLPAKYFEAIIQRMEDNPRIGTCSGKPYYAGKNGELISEFCGDEMSVGAAKFYRANCFQQIGKIVPEVMWDGIDCHRCRMFGWIACSWDDPEIRFIHLRPMGSSHRGILTGRYRHGYGQYYMGTSLAYMTASAIYRMAKPPYIVGGIAMWIGFVWNLISGAPRYEHLEFRRFLRRFQWECLFFGKKKATERLNARRLNHWDPTKNNAYSSGAYGRNSK